ncbi:MAG: hypothetical protein AVDCRST_MAG16-1500 [uncultured Frankineae bacterium]|uniref:N-acetyltransferase domain-containing protein n=1 Tax=uncultured Frankineae bacterium TaxID=437475 RepID=A0A6J4LMV9_9ACTN|nr:MAG: hypothetical protein AVDCRST_MAG16-1500 [uncultured Frankineae bacterium]
MRVRVATQLDEERVLDVLRADGEVTGRQPAKARLAAVRATLRAPTTLTLVGEDDGRVVGALLAELARRDDGPDGGEPGLLHLSLLCVRPDARRRGTGRALVRGLLDRFGRVSTWTSDPAAQALLVAEGFVATDQHDEAGRVRLVHTPR